MKKNECYLCSGVNHKKRDGKIRNLDGVDVLECENCSLVFLSSFEHINNEFYQKGEMHSGASVEQWFKLTRPDDMRRFKFLKNKIKGKKVLDFGSGNAGFLIEAKKVATKVVGIEIDETLTEHYQKNNILMVSDLSQVDEKFDFIMMFHVLEHLPDPKEILTQLSSKLEEGGQIIIEVPNSEDALLKVYKNKGFQNFTYWGCHLFLFNKKTIEKLFEDSVYKINKIKHVQRYGLANHLYWLLKNKPGGHNRWKALNIRFLNKLYEKLLSFFKITDTIVVNISLK